MNQVLLFNGNNNVHVEPTFDKSVKIHERDDKIAPLCSPVLDSSLLYY